MGADALLRVGEVHSPACCHSGRVLPPPINNSWTCQGRAKRARRHAGAAEDAVVKRGLNEILALASRQQRSNSAARPRCQAAHAVLAELPPLGAEDSFPRGAHWQVRLRLLLHPEAHRSRNR